MKLVYDINQKPPIAKNLLFAFQQVLAIMAATLLVPLLVNINSGTNYMSQPAVLLGAGCGTLFYIFMTKKKSPVFLGSSFAFISPLIGATAFGFMGIFLGALFAGLVYVIIALVLTKTGSAWVNKLLPAVVIGPTVALIGLSLCGSAVNNLTNTASDYQYVSVKEGYTVEASAPSEEAVSAFTVSGEFAGEEAAAADAFEIATSTNYSLMHILLGIFAFVMTVWASVKGPKWMRMVPFIIGILSAYVVGLLLNLCGLNVVDLSYFKGVKIFEVPNFTFLGMFKDGFKDFEGFSSVLNLFVLFAPVAFVTLAEHIADHKNLSTIVNRDLITDPGLDRTLIGDGAGSIVGAFFGGCPNTTYGESVGCVAITGNASVSTIIIAAIYCIVLAFFGPFTAFVSSIPTCIVGGVCIALYGFIAVSGLKMVQNVDLNDNRNLFVVAAILVTGIGGLELHLGPVTISSIACGLILGIIINVIFNRRKANEIEG